MKIWALIILVFGIDGSVDVRLNFPSDFKYNSLEICEQQGSRISGEIQDSNKTQIRVGWICKPVDLDKLEKSLPPKA
ncbi:hypothetical protein UFOVP787_193 [uncultured Caudovirales phage]|uniref:Uncharacterized protein n=1 Tax=uncultured Caudovirales phage TaxID=2100421 RepID=A0A6J5P5Z2_9CAUD|nr:hypothetical protein UFOVP787_193 [uncultured Caudovirales phage]